MSDTPSVSECANPNCRAKFKRLRGGKLAVFPVDDPAAWGLPKDNKLKAVWLCEACAPDLHISIDLEKPVIETVRRPQSRRSQAA